MRVLLLIPTLDQSGAEKQLMLLATGLPRPEVDVRVCCLTRGGPYQQELEQQGIPVTILHKRFRFDPVHLQWRGLSKLDPRCAAGGLYACWWLAGGNYGQRTEGEGQGFGV